MSPRRRHLTTATLLGLLALGCVAVPLRAQEPESEPLPGELLEARTVCLMDTLVMDAGLRDRFRSALEEWDRFEIVLFPDEADVLMSLSARADYTSRPVGEEDCDPADPLCHRAEGTTQVLEKLHLKVFVQGGDDLWTDEESVGEGDEAAARLVDRLRGRIEESENGDEG